jgi:acyl carrier protein
MSTITDLKEVLAAIVGDPELSHTLADDASLISDVSLDSLELLQFMLEVEASLGVEIDFERLDYEHLGSLRDLAAFLDTMPRPMQRLTGP